MCKDKQVSESLYKHLMMVGVSSEVLKALIKETAASGWKIEELWESADIENVCRMIAAGAVTRVKNEVAVAIAEKQLGIKKFHQN